MERSTFFTLMFWICFAGFLFNFWLVNQQIWAATCLILATLFNLESMREGRE